MSTTLEALQAQVEALTEALKSQGGGLAPTGRRSPVVGQLTNLLYPPPSATVAKANYFYEGMNLPHNPGTPFPALRFRLTEDGVEEKCVRNQTELDALGSEWSPIPPSLDLPSPFEAIQDQLAALSDEERRLVMQEQQKTRLSAIQAMLATLSPEEVAAIAGGQPAPKKKGRPKKVQ